MRIIDRVVASAGPYTDPVARSDRGPDGYQGDEGAEWSRILARGLNDELLDTGRRPFPRVQGAMSRACLAPCYAYSDRDVLGTLPTATHSGELLVERPSPGQS
jgi:hypothetical protein